jgi:hypothetical protein
MVSLRGAVPCFSRPVSHSLRESIRVRTVTADIYRRRADEHRALAAKASSEKERDGLLAVSELLEHLARTVSDSSPTE